MSGYAKGKSLLPAKPKKNLFYVKWGPFHVIEQAFVELDMLLNKKTQFQRTVCC